MDTALYQSAVAGARSVGFVGWRAEECELAALERVVRYKPLTPMDAWRQGRWAALDEYRKLTGWRRDQAGLHQVTWPRDLDGELEDVGDADAFAALEERWELEAQRERIRAWAARRSPRCQEVVEHMLEGLTGEQTATLLGITESRVSQILHDAAYLKRSIPPP